MDKEGTTCHTKINFKFLSNFIEKVLNLRQKYE